MHADRGMEPEQYGSRKTPEKKDGIHTVGCCLEPPVHERKFPERDGNNPPGYLPRRTAPVFSRIAVIITIDYQVYKILQI